MEAATTMLVNPSAIERVRTGRTGEPTGDIVQSPLQVGRGKVPGGADWSNQACRRLTARFWFSRDGPEYSARDIPRDRSPIEGRGLHDADDHGDCRGVGLDQQVWHRRVSSDGGHGLVVGEAGLSFEEGVRP